MHGDDQDKVSIWTLSARKDVNLTEMEIQFAPQADLEASGIGYEIDIPYFENRTGKRIRLNFKNLIIMK